MASENISDEHKAQLQAWYKDYAAGCEDKCLNKKHPAIVGLEDDQLDNDEMDEQVNEIALSVQLQDNFCKDCANLLQHWPIPDKDEGIVRPCSTLELEAAALVGCRFCALIYTRVWVTGQLPVFRKIERRISLLGENMKCSVSIWTCARDIQLIMLSYPGLDEFFNGRSGCSVTKFESHVIRPHKLWTDFQEVVPLIQMWLEICSSKHPKCRAIKTHVRPTRLISITDDHIKLVTTSDWDTMPHYATLSYCWGTKPFIKLLQSNLELFLDAIPIHELPKTIRDAIGISNSIGLQYIWIDALCIIQDSNNGADWEKECAKMTSIYSGGYINIAASDAIDANDGLLKRFRWYSTGFCARVTTSEASCVREFHIGSRVHSELAMENHLATRAWTLQENILAPRTVYLGERDPYWKCLSLRALQMLPLGFLSLKGRRFKWRLKTGGERLDWRTVIESFSSPKLTYGSDRLVALSGLASFQQSVTGDEYLAGMWKKSLLEQLSWSLCDEPTNRPAWRAPTWSWASVDGGVNWSEYLNMGLQDIHIEVAHVWVAPSALDPYGKVLAGELTLACNGLVCGRLCVYPEPADNTENCCYDGIGPKQQRNKTNAILLDSASRAFPINLDCSDDESVKRDNLAYLLPIHSGFTYSSSRKNTEDSQDDDDDDDDDSGWVDHYGVEGIIVQLSESRPGYFTRIGSFGYYDDGNPWDSDCEEYVRYEEFMSLLTKHGQPTADALCSRTEGKAVGEKFSYTLTIL